MRFWLYAPTNPHSQLGDCPHEVEKYWVIRTKYNRHLLKLIIVAFLLGFLLLAPYGVLPLIGLWIGCMTLVLVIRCPDCGIMTGEKANGRYSAFVPSRCWNCGFEYK